MSTAELKKPPMTFWQIWNMSFGFMGIQLGFALQNSNASGILRNYGAEIEQLSWFWLAAPIVGMIVQPIVGHYSDRTWNRLGRRKPYFLTGAILSSVALILMPNAWILGEVAPLVFIGAGFLMIMDASFNLAMEPFRALVADNLPDRQRTLGFSVQTSLIGIGAVIGSWLPWFLARLGAENQAPEGEVAFNIQLAFYIGAAIFLLSIIWTVVKTREFPPAEYEKYHGKNEDSGEGLITILRDFSKMPRTMRQLGLVQFFSWFALFGMWVFTTDSIATHIFGLPVTDKSSPAYREAQNWTGIIFGVYNLVSAVYALALARIAGWIGRKKTHAFSLVVGGVGLISFFFAPNKEFLIVSMACVGVAWASILAMPYVILSSSIPPGKMGIYMGIFNFFITIPQILNGLIGGPMVRYVYDNEPVYALVLAGIFLLCAAVSVIFVYDPADLAIRGQSNGARTI